MVNRLVGAHVSISPKYDVAIKEAEELDINTIQIFTHNPRGWSFKPINLEEINIFRKKVKEKNINPIISHCNYLINLATSDENNFSKSLSCFKKELKYANIFGCKYFVLHVGKHKGEGKEKGIKQVIKGINSAKKDILKHKVMVLLETVAGQGTEVGVDFNDLNKILIGVDKEIQDYLGVCLDTCHVFAAGYDIGNLTFIRKKINNSFGFDKIKVIHVNDSKGTLGSHLDRHEHIGEGYIGKERFKKFLNMLEIKNKPLILETPWDEKGDYFSDLKVLRKLLE